MLISKLMVSKKNPWPKDWEIGCCYSLGITFVYGLGHIMQILPCLSFWFKLLVANYLIEVNKVIWMEPIVSELPKLNKDEG